jgi:hypothetical protein
MKPLYTEVFTLKISSTQKRTLEKLKSRNIKVSDFVRKAISEKIKRGNKFKSTNFIQMPNRITNDCLTENTLLLAITC